MKKLVVAILVKYPDRKTIYQQLRDPKLEPSKLNIVSVQIFLIISFSSR